MRRTLFDLSDPPSLSFYFVFSVDPRASPRANRIKAFRAEYSLPSGSARGDAATSRHPLSQKRIRTGKADIPHSRDRCRRTQLFPAHRLIKYRKINELNKYIRVNYSSQPSITMAAATVN